jgi:hypothetical protein
MHRDELSPKSNYLFLDDALSCLCMIRVWGVGLGWGQETAAEGNLIVIIICDAKTHLSIYIIHQFSITCNYLSFRRKEKEKKKRKNPYATKSTFPSILNLMNPYPTKTTFSTSLQIAVAKVSDQPQPLPHHEHLLPYCSWLWKSPH